jgi:N-acetylglucosaminyldiphosphoundecaprenol N-acetyl-beta-D-mannosaminyltransferase
MKEISEIYNWNIKLNLLTINEFITIIEQNIINRTTLIQQTSVNAYTIVCIQNDNDLREIINKSSLVNIDGMSVVWALTFLGYKNITKASCPDIFDRLIELSSEKGYKPFFLGATAEIIESAMINLQSKYPTLQIAGYHHGYFSDEESEKIAEIIRDSKADMLFLGISSPKKELFSNKYSEYMQIPYTFGVGGVFDIIAGVTKRAPMWMQKSGLEWFYRFIQEPRRMWRRYLIGNIKFIWIVMKEKFKK